MKLPRFRYLAIRGNRPPGIDRLIVEQIDPRRLAPGGIDTCIHDIVKYTSDRTVAIVGACSESGSLPLGVWTQIEFAGKRVYFLPVVSLDRADQNRRIPHSLRLALGCAHYALGIPRAKVVQTHRIEMGLVAFIMRRGPISQFLHTDSIAHTSRNSDSIWRFIARGYRFLELHLLPKMADVVIFNATDVARISQFVPKARAMRTWFDPETFSPGALAEPIAKNAAVVLWVGRLEEQKNPKLAIDVLAQLKGAGVEAELRIVGDGTLRKVVVDYAASLGVSANVQILGRVDRKTVAVEMAKAGVLLMTSHYEGSSRVLLEAGAMGLPVAATPGSDPDKSLHREVNGIRTRGYDPRELAAAVSEVVHYSSLDCQAAVDDFSASRQIERLLSR